MATLVASRAAAGVAVFKPSGSGSAGRAYGSYTITTAPAAADIIQFCRIPKGAVVTGGLFWGHLIEASADVLLDFDIGWAANGVESADPDGFGNFGALSAAAVTGVKPEVGYRYALGGTLYSSEVTAPPTFSAETIITGTFVASCANFTIGTFHVAVDYVVP